MPADLVDSWDDVPTALRPVAPMTGPFPMAPFLEAWRSHHTSSDTRAPIAVTATAALPLWIDRGVVRLSGEADLTDYHSPLGASIDECVALVAHRFSGHTFSFDSLPREALDPLASALAAAGVVPATSRHGATLVIDLPADAETWTASLPKRDRHELRRKRRRFVDVLGEPLLERRTDTEAFEAFITMHRSSRRNKGGFMTESMERFFWSLIIDADASIDLISVAGSPVAAAFGFVDTSAFYVYNSAYVEDAADASPGIVLLASMIERSIDGGLRRFDFLKGDEEYKYRLGAIDRPLTVLEGEIPVIERVAYLVLHTSPLLQPGIGSAGGMNVYVDELARTMAGRGVEAVVFTRRTDPDQPASIEVRDGYRVVHIDAGPAGPLPMSELMSHVAEFGEGVVAETRNAGFDLVHSHYWLSGWAGVLVKEVHGLPLANSFHTLGRVKDVGRRSDEAPSSTARLRAEDGVIAASDCVIASTPYEFDDLIEHYAASPERLCISQPGIDHTLFTPGNRDEARVRVGIGDEPLILCVGRIQAHKGFDVAIDMLSHLPKTLAAGSGPPLLMIIGGPSGPDGRREVERLHARARAIGVSERVLFVPPQPHGSLVDYYRAADLLVIPSHSESFGLVAAEAQASGLPVVAARVGGLPYVVGASTSGLLVEGRDPRSFAAAATAILDHPRFRSSLSTGAVEFAARFSWDGTADRLLDLYSGIMGR